MVSPDRLLSSKTPRMKEETKTVFFIIRDVFLFPPFPRLHRMVTGAEAPAISGDGRPLAAADGE